MNLKQMLDRDIKREIGRSNRTGFKTILLHLVISSVGLCVLDMVHNDFRAIIMLIVTLTLFFLWNSAIKSVIETGLIYSFIISLYFTVPSAITGISYYNSYMHPFELDWILSDLTWLVINYPFTIGNLQFGSSDSYNIGIQIFMPIVAINMLVLFNYLYCKLQAIKEKKRED